MSLSESSSVQLRSNEDLEGPECSNYCQSCERCISLVTTILDQQSAQLNKVKERNIRSIRIRIIIYIQVKSAFSLLTILPYSKTTGHRYSGIPMGIDPSTLLVNN